SRDRAPASIPRSAVPFAALLTVVVSAATAGLVRLDRALLTSGAFRYGRVNPSEQPVLFYEDGRTATVAIHRSGFDSLYVLTTNGKPDASLTARWLRAAVEPVPPGPILEQDESTQMLAPLVTLAHAPGARAGAVIGHGSGISSHFLLSDPRLDSLVTIEIEPRIVDASYLYYPANHRVFDDPRSRIAIADAKSFFAGRRGRYDLIVSEPSNPWVSGTASLFSVEFYREVRHRLTGRGVFGQWLHLYETSDDLVISVLAALHRSFPAYRAYLVGDSDLLIVATVADRLPEPDWSLLDGEALRRELRHVLPLRADHLRGSRAFERTELAPLLDAWPRPNSDHRPLLDLHSERTRFEDAFATGVYGLLLDRFRVAAALGGWRLDPTATPGVPIPGLAPQHLRAVAFEVRRRLVDPAAETPRNLQLPVRHALVTFRRLLSPPATAEATEEWAAWLRAFVEIEATLHAGTAGFADEAFYRAVRETLGEVEPPATVTDAVTFTEGIAAWNFEDAADAARKLVEAAGAGAPLVGALDPGTLLDGAVVSFLRIRDPEAADRAYAILAPRARRADTDFRARLLRAHIARALEAPPTGGGP
ncbi:MAG: hypothetical protein ACRELC_08920, partial [Gemmatimonadota bacterium]